MCVHASLSLVVCAIFDSVVGSYTLDTDAHPPHPNAHTYTPIPPYNPKPKISFDPFPRGEEEEFFFRGKATPLDNVKTMKVTDCFITPREMVRVLCLCLGLGLDVCRWGSLAPVVPSNTNSPKT